MSKPIILKTPPASANRAEVIGLPAWFGNYRDTPKMPPEWAVEIARRECTARRLPLTLCWTVITRNYVSGYAYSRKTLVRYGEPYTTPGACVTIMAGKNTERDYQLFVLLHEIAHVNVGPGRWHDEVWQKEAVRLYRKHDLLTVLASEKYWTYPTELKAIQKAARRSGLI